MGAEELTGNESGVPPEEEPTAAAGQTEEPKMVPLEVVQKMDKDMQLLKNEVGNLRNANEIFKGMIAQQQQKPETGEEFPDDYVPTAGEIRAMMRKEMGKVENTFKQEQERSRGQQLARQQIEVRERHPDFDDVAELAEEMGRKNPALVKALLALDDPYEGMYAAGMLHPKYLEKLKTKETKTAGETIAKNLNRQRTLADVGGGGEPTSEPNWVELAIKDPMKIEERLQELIQTPR